MSQLPKDWFAQGLSKLIEEAAVSTGLSSDEVHKVFTVFYRAGMIDSDYLKDGIYERYYYLPGRK